MYPQDAEATNEKVPAVQGVQLLLPSAEYVPAGQGSLQLVWPDSDWA